VLTGHFTGALGISEDAIHVFQLYNIGMTAKGGMDHVARRWISWSGSGRTRRIFAAKPPPPRTGPRMRARRERGA